MEARIFPAAALLAVAVMLNPRVLLGAGTRTANFVIDAPTPELAEEIGQAAERYRHDLAITWIGSPMPNWSRPCPIHADVAPNLGAGGQTSFVFANGEVGDWDMRIQGSEERILDSVLPHEVTHTIFASYFRRGLPRWADEGACTTVEHWSERNKQQVMLVNFLRTDRGIAFDKLFAIKEYPHDVLPLYSEGYSLAQYLIEQGGRQKFLQFVGDGMKSENWPAATQKYYGYPNLQALQDEWLGWVKQGSPTLVAQQPNGGLAANGRPESSGGGPLYRAQSDDRDSLASGTNSAPIAGHHPAASWSKNSDAVDDQGWGPVRDSSDVASTVDSAAGSRSVYERSSAPPSPKNPEYLAQRDVPSLASTGSTSNDAAQGHQVLLQWTR
ncbi:MAG TPA: hypothetical protein VMJ32_16610 [Pirellulales bacterium]|nr:hypothetical protein [Pirellulales bacterium]